MRAIFAIIITVCVAFAPAECFARANSPFMEAGGTLLTPTEDKAVVRFIRPALPAGSLINFNLMDGDKVIGNSLDGTQFDYLADPGEHLFIVTIRGNKAFMTANLEAGKTYYVLLRIYAARSWTYHVVFVPAKKNSRIMREAKEYQDELDIYTPNKEKLLEWQNKHKDDIDKLLLGYKTAWRLEQAWPELRPQDGV